MVKRTVKIKVGDPIIIVDMVQNKVTLALCSPRLTN
jgi:hypothetical protein